MTRQIKPKCSKDVLYDLYINQQQSLSKIASIYSCSHHSVKRWLKHFDIPIRTKTEQQNMLENGYDWIYDCGNAVFRL